MIDNYQLITKGFQLLTEVLAPYVCQQFQKKFGQQRWWQRGVLDVLHDHQKRDLPYDGDWSTYVDSLDAARCLILLDANWDTVFKIQLSREHRNWIKELINTRNKWAHKGGGDISSDDAWRALDTMARLLEHIDTENTEAIREIARLIRYGTNGASTTVTNLNNYEPQLTKAPEQNNVLTSPPRQGFLPWRLVVSPHPDVAQGRYRQAEFAADLSQVQKGTAEIEYQDPVEFFGRTYITEGMAGLLTQAILRVIGKGGEPIIQLKTAFGGGKTHSMLALYHLLRGQTPLSKIPNAAAVLKQADVSDCPKVKVAILVGTALNPSKVRRPVNFPGITIRTLWGEMAAQLAEQAGDPKLYNIIKDADKASVPPGSETLAELFDVCGPCLILIDELVAYARKIYGASGLPSGTFEAVLTFVQELTEAARRSKNSLVVASIPESDIEIGGEGGKKALEAIEHTFGRMESIWKPVVAEEGFEIVRRRLFLPLQDLASQNEVCRAFSEMYREDGSEFPTECKELAYFDRLKSCYPIHPEVFDRLYNDWATLERFQKTRGVLRLMAAAIHDLWVRQDSSLMIMPSTIPLDTVQVREELTRYLPEGWNTVIESDIDGPRSLPYKIDVENPRFTRCMAARRVARSIFMGSAPSVKEQNVRGIEDIRVRLGVKQPGEQISVFNDALGKMLDKLTHLYSSNQRYWYDLPPNLRRTVEDRAQQVGRDELEMEIEGRLKAIRDRADFSGTHNCVSSSLDVPDDQSVRLVVLGPENSHKTGSDKSKAITTAREILETRGTAPRIYRNMLAFVAPDKDVLPSLESETRKFLAWKSVVDDAEALNLDAHQRRQATESLKRSTETVDLRMKEAYCWLLVPTQDGANPVEWETTRISGGAESHIKKASGKMKSSEQLIVRWAPALLRMELDRWLWKDQDHISVRKLWEFMSSYCYLQRLRDEDVLLASIKEGITSKEFFGYAQGVTDAGQYLALSLGRSVNVDLSGYLVKPDVAERQLTQDTSEPPPRPPMPPVEPPSEPPGGYPPPGDPPVRKPRRYYGTVQLDSTRVGRDAGKIAEEVIQHLSSLMGTKVKITMEIEADIPDGVPDNVVRTVTENSRTLRFTNSDFEED
ncbi:MAG: ATP-binding protein [Firmicutes bacterium]|nr:ATP-binding protein [Bacillota bacterium]